SLLYTLRSLYPGKRSDLRYLTRGRSKYSLKRVRPTPRAITNSLSCWRRCTGVSSFLLLPETTIRSSYYCLPGIQAALLRLSVAVVITTVVTASCKLYCL
ncbi:hypothetical protein GIB67_024557, partial [Kingdonia uniflora]